MNKEACKVFKTAKMIALFNNVKKKQYFILNISIYLRKLSEWFLMSLSVNYCMFNINYFKA